ncbi:MAG: O-antigen ligase family protein [Candidatus Buchananbacteria bacterium]|nr:O-antigen ligase family protein [Candidatus Buchananbacteria bacterium]
MNLDKSKVSAYLLNIIKIGALVIVFLPLVMNSQYFFPFIVFKNVLFRITTEIILVAYLILAQFNPSYRPKFPAIAIAVFALLGISALSTLTGIGIYSSFWGNYERMSGLFHQLHLVAFFFVLFNVFRSKKDWYSLFTFSIFASMLMAFLGLAQWLEVPFLLRSSGGTRLTGTIGNATFFAAYLIFNIFFVLYFFAKDRRFDLKLFGASFLAFDAYLFIGAILYKLSGDSDWGFLNVLRVPLIEKSIEYPVFLWSFIIFQLALLGTWLWRNRPQVVRGLLGIVFLFEFFILYNTETRGALIGLAAGLVLLVAASIFKPGLDRRLKIAGVTFVVLILLSPLILVANKNSNFVQSDDTLRRLATISLTDITTESRILTWQASWRGWSESVKSFLIGYGPENYYYTYNKYFPVEIYKDNGSQIWFDRAHNVIFDYGVTTGILGLGAYLTMLGLAIWALFKQYRQGGSFSSSWLFIGLIVAYFIQNIFVFDTMNTEIPLYATLAFVVFLSQSKSAESFSETDDLGYKPINYLAVTGLVLLLGLGIFGINVKTLRANHYIYEALTTNNLAVGAEDGSFDLLKKSVEESVVGKFEARQQLSNFVAGLVRNSEVSASQIKQVLNYTDQQLQKSVAEEPLNIRQYLFLSTYYNATTRVNQNNPQRVLDLLEPAVYLSPTRPHVYYEIAQAYAFQNNFEKAEEYFKKGLELAPWVKEDYWNVLTIYIVFEKYEQSDSYIEYMKSQLDWEPGLNDYKKLADLYSRVKNYDRMIKYQEKVAELEPSAANYAKLAAMYAAIGENQKAKELTQRAVNLNPDFAAEAQKFLELLEQGELLDQQ